MAYSQTDPITGKGGGYTPTPKFPPAAPTYPTDPSTPPSGRSPRMLNPTGLPVDPVRPPGPPPTGVKGYGDPTAPVRTGSPRMLNTMTGDQEAKTTYNGPTIPAATPGPSQNNTVVNPESTTNDTPPPGDQNSGDANKQRVLDALAAVHSTDDPSYWLNKIGGDPNGYGSAWDYWNDRIRRGNGSELVKNGQLSLFNDGPGGGHGGFNGQPTPFGNFAGLFGSGSGGILGNPSGVSDNLIKMLTDKAQQSLNIDPSTDKIIKPQVDAAAATQERGRRNYLNDMAESSNPYATGAMNTAGTQTAETASQNVSQLQSQLVQNELNSRRQEIMGAMQGMGNLLTADQQLNLQRELDSVNSGLASQQIGNNFTLGAGQLGLGWGNLGLGYAGLGSQNDQFAARFGMDQTNNANYWDAIRRGLIK